MPTKLQKAKERKAIKHVATEEAQEWQKQEYPPIDADVARLRTFIGLLFMGMKDMQKFLHELEDYVNDPENSDTYMMTQGRIKTLEMEVGVLTKRLNDALAEEPETPADPFKEVAS